MPLLSVRDLVTRFRTGRGVVVAVDHVSFDVAAGETLAIVGESGSGKSVTALSILRLIPDPPGVIESGQILFDGQDLLKLGEAEIRAVRGNRIAMIFQEPMSSLNPALTVGMQVGEPVNLHRRLPWSAALARARELLGMVRMSDAAARAVAYPHQFSGGMRQRAMIAMALACGPQLLIADEPTTALDVTIQAQILDILNRLQEEYKLSVLLITHDMGVVAETCRRVVVMYTGRVVEEAPVHELFATPKHPYTQGLLRSIPKPFVAGAEKPDRLPTIVGTVPDLLELPVGCKFAPRCPDVMDRCTNEEPPEFVTGTGCRARCWLHEGKTWDGHAAATTPAPATGARK